MPHAWIEYSKNIADDAEVQGFGRCVHDAMMETGIFPLAGVRIRINRIDDCIVADGKPENAFVHLAIRIGEGRDMETKQAAADLIFERISAGNPSDYIPLAKYSSGSKTFVKELQDKFDGAVQKKDDLAASIRQLSTDHGALHKIALSHGLKVA